MEHWDPSAPKEGEQAPDLTLLDEAGKPLQLSQLARGGPVLLLFFAGVEDPRGRSLLRDYRDVTLSMQLLGVKLYGVSRSEPSANSFLRMEMGMGFPLLANPDAAEIRRFGMDDAVGTFLLDRRLRVVQRGQDERAAPAGILRFLRRGGLREKKPTLVERVANLFKSVQHGLHPRKPLTR
ncbi:MAG TPA: redoxin domain-containing protein [Myxococcales bacterium]|jgi:peroxiredoxin